MRVLILGIEGMLGRELWRQFKEDKRFDVFGTCRSSQNNNLFLFYAHNKDRLNEIIGTAKPEIIVNCIGIIKSDIPTTSVSQVIYVNSYFPNLLGEICEERKIKLIHISTDCVFDGKKEIYYNYDMPNAVDLYGRSKALGEVGGKHLTIRTSFIGFSKKGKGLLEWFLKQKKCIGYKNHFWNGFTTVEFGKFLKELILNHIEECGIKHLGGSRISKYELLMLINEKFKVGVNINGRNVEEISRVLKNDFDWWDIPSYEQMIEELYMDCRRN